MFVQDHKDQLELNVTQDPLDQLELNVTQDPLDQLELNVTQDPLDQLELNVTQDPNQIPSNRFYQIAGGVFTTSGPASPASSTVFCNVGDTLIQADYRIVEIGPPGTIRSIETHTFLPPEGFQITVVGQVHTVQPIAASNDVALRKSIRKFALGEGKLLDSISAAEVQKLLQEMASQLWLENQKYMSNEVGFTILTKEEVETQVEEIMKELVEIRSGRNRHPK